MENFEKIRKSVLSSSAPQHTEVAESIALGHGTLLILGAGTDGLPLLTASQDLLFTPHAFEGVRLDCLYMACAEARRVLKTGGRWVVVVCDPEPATGWRKFFPRPTAPALHFEHYISPEDWHTERAIALTGGNRLFILRKKNESEL